MADPTRASPEVRARQYPMKGAYCQVTLQKTTSTWRCCGKLVLTREEAIERGAVVR